MEVEIVVRGDVKKIKVAVLGGAHHKLGVGGGIV